MFCSVLYALIVHCVQCLGGTVGYRYYVLGLYISAVFCIMVVPAVSVAFMSKLFCRPYAICKLNDDDDNCNSFL